MGDVTAAGLVSRGVLGGGEPGEGHEHPGGPEPAPVADLSGQAERPELGDATVGGQAGHDLSKRGALIPQGQVALDRGDGDLPGAKGGPVVGVGGLEGQIVEALRADLGE